MNVVCRPEPEWANKTDFSPGAMVDQSFETMQTFDPLLVNLCQNVIRPCSMASFSGMAVGNVVWFWCKNLQDCRHVSIAPNDSVCNCAAYYAVELEELIDNYTGVADYQENCRNIPRNL